MSVTQVKAFVAKADADDALRAAFNKIMDNVAPIHQPAEIVKLAATVGYTFTEADYHRAREEAIAARMKGSFGLVDVASSGCTWKITG